LVPASLDYFRLSMFRLADASSAALDDVRSN
jgi:hypothetical protein